MTLAFQWMITLTRPTTSDETDVATGRTSGPPWEPPRLLRVLAYATEPGRQTRAKGPIEIVALHAFWNRRNRRLRVVAQKRVEPCPRLAIPPRRHGAQLAIRQCEDGREKGVIRCSERPVSIAMSAKSAAFNGGFRGPEQVEVRRVHAPSQP